MGFLHREEPSRHWVNYRRGLAVGVLGLEKRITGSVLAWTV